jgi:hypothetical protein
VTGNLKNEFDERAAASAEDTRQKIVQVVSEENAKFTELREGMQKLLDSTQSMSAAFSGQVEAAKLDLGQKHDATLAELQARDAQLRAFVDETQAGNQATFELLSAQLASVGDGKQAELEHKITAMVATLRDQLAASADVLYTEAMANARTHLGTGSFEGGKSEGKGGARERALFDPRDYKIPDLASTPSMAVFKKWRHDFELFIETIGSSWKGSQQSSGRRASTKRPSPRKSSRRSRLSPTGTSPSRPTLSSASTSTSRPMLSTSS